MQLGWACVAPDVRLTYAATQFFWLILGKYRPRRFGVSNQRDASATHGSRLAIGMGALPNPSSA
ncbi:MAG TPA: hypothetical protein VF739_03410 [Ktedonobacterales bacterium]